MKDRATTIATLEAKACGSLPALTAGVDVGDRHCSICIIDAAGEEVERRRVRTTTSGLDAVFAASPPMRVVLEVGTHSPWISRRITSQGHEVFVANARKVRAIYENDSKDDDVDAEMLARLGRVDPKLLRPIRHRTAKTSQALAVVRSREGLVRARTLLINHVRGAVKPAGGRVKACSSESFARQAPDQLPVELRAVLLPVVEQIGHLTRTIREFDRQIETLCAEQYPETKRLREIPGVGPVTALTFVLTIEDPIRFPVVRDVGAYLGLCRRRDKSGESDPQLGISKAGDPFLRHLLVGCAQYILGRHAPPSAIRRWGLRKAGIREEDAGRGGKRTKQGRVAKKIAVVGVARRLAVVMLRLWVNDEPYQPFPPDQQPRPKAPAISTPASAERVAA